MRLSWMGKEKELVFGLAVALGSQGDPASVTCTQLPVCVSLTDNR